MSETITTFSEVTAEIQAAKQAYQDTLTKIKESGGIKDMFKAFFEKRPDVKAISWSQYIPGFNDGDPCVFSMTDVVYADAEANLEDWSGGWLDGEEGWHDTYTIANPEKVIRWEGSWPDRTAITEPNEDYDPDIGPIVQFVNSNAELMEELFGTYAAILITPEEIRTEEFDPGY